MTRKFIHCPLNLKCSKCGCDVQKRGRFKNPVCFKCKRERIRERARRYHHVDKKMAKDLPNMVE